MDDLAFVAASAAEIDRIVIRAHELAADYSAKPAVLSELTAYPQLLNTAAIVLLARPLTREAIGRIVPYTPPELIDALLDNNRDEGVVTVEGGQISLTDRGRLFAEAVVEVQDTAVAHGWSSATDHLEAAQRLLASCVDHAATLKPPRTPSNFELFAPAVDRRSPAARVLRLVTALRYWRADAHACVLAEAGLEPFEAHALNRLWDEHRGIDRVGQGFPRPGSKGVASLEERGLAVDGGITARGIEIREEIERETDRATLPAYAALDERMRADLLAAITAIPA